MKKILFVTFSLIASFAVKAQTAPTPAQDPIDKFVKFNEIDHDMGKIPFGKPIEYDVVMKNISKDSIRIENVQASCGCTTPKWKPGPYAPGETFRITLGFNGGNNGPFRKTVTVFFTHDMTKMLAFHGEGVVEQQPATTISK